MKEDSNNSIIQRIKKGDTACLEELLTAYKSYCVNGLKKKTRCTDEDAEELFIDALLELRENILSDRLEHLINVKSYIFGICYNTWLTRQRTEKRNLEKQKDVALYYREYLQDDFLFSQDGSADYKMQLIEIAHQALEDIDEKCRTIIRYFYLEKRSMDEIAGLMNFASPDVAKTSKLRCFKKLLEKVKEMEQK